MAASASSPGYVTHMRDVPDDPWERASSAHQVADEIAAVVARAREAGIDDETILRSCRRPWTRCVMA